MSGVTVIVGYRPLPGRSDALDRLAAEHVARLYGEGLVTAQRPMFMRAEDGTLIEVFEWKSQRAIDAAHDNPVVQQMWGEYAAVCEYVKVGDLPEAAQLFSGFSTVHLPLRPLALSHLFAHVQVDRHLGTSGALSADQLHEIAAHDYGVLINLLPDDRPNALAGEAEIARGHGLHYAHLPVDFAAPTVDDLHAFEQEMQHAGPEARVWAHCAANQRVSVFVALYGMRKRGWTRQRAEELIAEVWTPNPTWRAFFDQLAPRD